jgi:KUP system potassium uptake protein
VLGFRSSTSLAAAYGLAVTSTMVITTLLFAVVLRERFHWSRPAAWGLCATFLGVEAGFFGAILFKIPHGGWFPLLVGAAVFTLLTTWHTGRQLVRERIRRGEVSLASFLDGVFEAPEPPQRIRGTAVYLFGDPNAAPPALIANLRHNGVLHERVVILAVITDRVPRVPSSRRSVVIERGHGVHGVELHYGFLEDPDVPRGLTEGDAGALGIDPDRATFFLGGESLHVTHRPGMALWREHLFAAMVRNATSAADYFCLPADRTITVGVQVEL